MNREMLLGTRTLEEAVSLLFGKEQDSSASGRMYLLDGEPMEGDLAREYDSLGRTSRQNTYRSIAEDFKNRAGCYGCNHAENYLEVGAILEVGCGSGLLTLELAEMTNSRHILGLDISADMLALAQQNLHQRAQMRVAEIKRFQERIQGYGLSEKALRRLETNPPPLDRITFLKGDAYDLEEAAGQFPKSDYVVCRNVLHRLRFPDRGIAQMYSALAPGGKLYIRDLRRDADWKTVLERIGERRWRSATLVKDYVAAMASMLTTRELETMLKAAGINDFAITDGSYVLGRMTSDADIQEFEKDAEYVCVIKR